MFIYDRKLQYPVKIKTPNPALAKIIISQVGGPDGELAASTRYLSQRFSMPNRNIAGMLTDIGVEELAHVEMISAIIYQLTRNLSPEEIKRAGFDTYFVDHTTGVYPQAASGTPFTTAYIGVKGDVLADLHEDLAADAAITNAQLAKSALQKNSKYRDFAFWMFALAFSSLQSHKCNRS
ncbi:MAG: manganese catalase family protein [Clostridia bacterium]|nr:manganese catalase family protein [Clostridia bacterium]